MTRKSEMVHPDSGVKAPWYEMFNPEKVDTPCLIVYYDRVVKNIQRLKQMVGDDQRIRPHVKTNKMAEVCQLLQKNYINKFKCATIAEAEMLGEINAADVLLAYQPIGPKINRWIALLNKYPDTVYSCLVDNITSAKEMSYMGQEKGMTIAVFIDIDTGMHRTGIKPSEVKKLFLEIQPLPNINVIGLHVYDGHLKIKDPVERQQESDRQFEPVARLLQELDPLSGVSLQLIVGGSPSFSTHIQRKRAQVSPGTFVFWDSGYATAYPDLPFEPAALVMTRVVSVLENDTYTLDLGTKAVASEMAFPRVHFLNKPDLQEVFHSEEHLNVRFKDNGDKPGAPPKGGDILKTGDLLYGLPFHICPTVALYDEAIVVKDEKIFARWRIEARKRTISI